MVLCYCDDGNVTVCTRRCGHCSGCLSCRINSENGNCYCIRLKPDCKHRSFNPSFPNCPCDDGQTTRCTRRCGHCGGCLSCGINLESGKCNCINLKPHCDHAAFNSSFPDCPCDDGEFTSCTLCCGHCGGCLGCGINLESGKCNCTDLKPDCNHAAFNPSFPDCPCDDGENNDCKVRCGHCDGCLSCNVNRESGECNCINLKPDCEHKAFNLLFPDCPCDDGGFNDCKVHCGYCDGCLSCNVNREGGDCNCINLKSDCEHKAFNLLFPDCPCDDGGFNDCKVHCGYCDGCLSCNVNREGGDCNCINLKPDCQHEAFNPLFPDCPCDDGAINVCKVHCGYCDGCLSCNVNREGGECNCINLKPDCQHEAFNPLFPDCPCDDGAINDCKVRCGYCDGCLSCNVNREGGECNCINLKSDCQHASVDKAQRFVDSGPKKRRLLH